MDPDCKAPIYGISLKFYVVDLKVLVVDDNKEITDMLALYFETQGIEFNAINDGQRINRCR
jgi:CheY-like chemotaxis protein